MTNFQKVIVDHKYVCNFTMVDNRILKDKRLSIESMGILIHLLSFSNNWHFNMKTFCDICNCKKYTVQKGMRLLQDLGYLKITKKHNPNTGQFETTYEVYEQPNLIDKENIERQDSDLIGTEKLQKQLAQSLKNKPENFEQDEDDFEDSEEEIEEEISQVSQGRNFNTNFSDEEMLQENEQEMANCEEMLQENSEISVSQTSEDNSLNKTSQMEKNSNSLESTVSTSFGIISNASDGKSPGPIYQRWLHQRWLHQSWLHQRWCSSLYINININKYKLINTKYKHQKNKCKNENSFLPLLEKFKKIININTKENSFRKNTCNSTCENSTENMSSTSPLVNAHQKLPRVSRGFAVNCPPKEDLGQRIMQTGHKASSETEKKTKTKTKAKTNTASCSVANAIPEKIGDNTDTQNALARTQHKLNLLLEQAKSQKEKEGFKAKQAKITEENIQTYKDLDDDLKLLFIDYLQVWTVNKKPMCKATLQKQIEELKQLGQTKEERCLILRRAITNGWTSLHALTTKDKQNLLTQNMLQEVITTESTPIKEEYTDDDYTPATDSQGNLLIF